jgi:hypothetical protein
MQMSKKTRYLIILASFIVFFLLAPAIIFYVSGLTYDFAQKKFIKTGTLNINVEPKKTDIFINNDLERTSSGNVKFLIPKEYGIKIQKQGYFEWYKRLKVEPGKVTWAAQTQKIFLLMDPPKQTEIDSNVSDFAISGKNLVYIKGSELAISSVSDPLQNTKIQIPKSVDRIWLSSDARFAVLESGSLATSSPAALLFDSDSAAFTDLTSLFDSAFQIEFSGNDIYALNEGALYKIDTSAISKTPLLKNVSAFALYDNNLYFIQNDGNAANLYVSELPSQEKNILIKNLPAFTKAQIIINSKKQGFIILDKTLYKIGSALDLLANGANEWNMGTGNESLIYDDSGELDYFSGNAKNFITRTSGQLKNLALDTASNYAFCLKGDNLTAIELDTRDHQNEYGLYNSEQIKKFSLDNEAKNIFVLDGQDLKVLQIR